MTDETATPLDLDAIRADRARIHYISDGTRGSDRVGRLLNSVSDLIAEVERLRAATVKPDREAAAQARHVEDTRAALDALDTAEEKVDRQRDRLRAREEQARRLRAEVTRLHELVADMRAARTAPVWDEEAVVEAMAREAYRRLHPARVLTPDSKRTRESDVREMDRAYATWDAGQEGWAHGITCRKIASHLLAVVREHLPVQPDREAVARVLAEDLHHLMTADSWGLISETGRNYWRKRADAVLDLLPGRSEAEVKAEALQGVHAKIEGAMTALDAYTDEHAETARTALRGCLRVVDRLAAEGGAS